MGYFLGDTEFFEVFSVLPVKQCRAVAKTLVEKNSDSHLDSASSNY